VSSPSFRRFPTPPGLELPQPQALIDLLARVAPLAGPLTLCAGALIRPARLAPERRELVIIRVAVRTGNSYCLSGHLQVGSHVGLDRAQIEVALEGPVDRATDELDRALLRATDELVDQGRVSSSVKAVLAEVLDEESVIELAVLVGQYVLIGMLCATFGLECESPPPAPASYLG
jgi:4-carboxymuconolactone decarboxylase